MIDIGPLQKGMEYPRLSRAVLLGITGGAGVQVGRALTHSHSIYGTALGAGVAISLGRSIFNQIDHTSLGRSTVEFFGSALVTGVLTLGLGRWVEKQWPSAFPFAVGIGGVLAGVVTQYLLEYASHD